MFVKALGNRCFFFGVNCVYFSFKLDILAASRGQSQTSSVSMPFGRAHLARHSAGVGGSSLGALLRKRKVTGRDASLPAPLLTASLKLSVRGTVGALPQTPPEAPPLDSARGNFPLDPFRAIELSSPPYFFRVLPFSFFTPQWDSRTHPPSAASSPPAAVGRSASYTAS